MSQYFVFRSEKRYGPFSIDEMKELLKNRRVGFEDLVWKEGMEKWLSVFEMPEFADLCPAMTSHKMDDNTMSVSGYSFEEKELDEKKRKKAKMLKIVGVVVFFIVLAIGIKVSIPLMNKLCNYDWGSKSLRWCSVEYKISKISYEGIKLVELYNYPPVTLLHPDIRELLLNENFTELNRLLSRAFTQYQRDFRYEQKLYSAYHSFKITDIQYRKKFSLWIQNSTNRYEPYLARAFYHIAIGNKFKGRRKRKEMTERTSRLMRKYYAKAEKDLKKVISINPDVITAYSRLIEINKINSKWEANKVLVKDALKKCTFCFNVRESFMETLRPRWHGSIPEMKKFADEALIYALKNPRLKVLASYIYEDMAAMLVEFKKFPLAFEYFNKGLVFGENWKIYRGRAYLIYLHSDEYEKALVDINRSIKINPVAHSNYILRAKIYSRLKDFKKSLRDVGVAEVIRPDIYKKSKVRKQLADYVLKLGQEQLDDGALDSAKIYFDVAQKYKADYSKVFYWIGKFYQRSGDNASYEKYLIKSVEISPLDYKALKILSDKLLNDQKYKKGIEYLSKYIEKKPNEASAYFERSIHYYNMENNDMSIEDLRKACDLGSKEGCEKLESK